MSGIGCRCWPWNAEGWNVSDADVSTYVWRLVAPFLTLILNSEYSMYVAHEFRPMADEFVITSEGGVTFNEEIELGDGDWADYDAENDAPVSLSGIEFKFESV